MSPVSSYLRGAGESGEMCRCASETLRRGERLSQTQGHLAAGDAPQRGFRLELVGEKKKKEKEKAFKELLALNEPRSSIYCSIVHVIWQQKMHHLRARGENQRN